MAARFESVVAVRVPNVVERELKRRAREDDRSLGAYLRRELTRMTMATDTPPKANTDADADGHV
jgi:hypothetical protein